MIQVEVPRPLSLLINGFIRSLAICIYFVFIVIQTIKLAKTP